MIDCIGADRFLFETWICDTQGHWNSLARVVIADKFFSSVLLTVLETDEDKINASNQVLTEAIFEDLQTVDGEGDGYRPGILLESEVNSIPFSLMFF